MEVDCDDELLAAEIIRLKQELEETLQASKEFDSEDLDPIEEPQLIHEASQIDFIDEEACFKYLESDDDCSGDAMLSYDEITIDTAEFLLADPAPEPRHAPPSRTPSQLEALLQANSPPQRQRQYLAEPIVENTDLLQNESERNYDEKSYISYDEVTVATADLFAELTLLEEQNTTADPDMDQLRHLLMDHIAQKQDSVPLLNTAIEPQFIQSSDTNSNDGKTIDAGESVTEVSEALQVSDKATIDFKDTVAEQAPMDDGERLPDYANERATEKSIVETDNASFTESVAHNEMQELAQGVATMEAPNVLSVDDEIRLMQEQMLKSPWPSPTKKQSQPQPTASDFLLGPYNQQPEDEDDQQSPEMKSPITPKQQLDVPPHLIPISPNHVSSIPKTSEVIESPQAQVPKAMSPRSTSRTSLSTYTSPEQKRKSPKIESQRSLDRNRSPKQKPDVPPPTIMSPQRNESQVALSSNGIKSHEQDVVPSITQELVPLVKELKSSTQKGVPTITQQMLTLESGIKSPEQDHGPLTTQEMLHLERESESPERDGDASITQDLLVSPTKSKKTKTVRVRKVRKKVPGTADFGESCNSLNSDIISSPNKERSPLTRSPKASVLNDIPLNRMQLPSNLLSDIRLQKKDKNDMDQTDETTASKHVPIKSKEVLPSNAAGSAKLISSPKSDQNDTIARSPPMFNLLGAIEQAATKRVQRLEETGGELIMQDIAPEVEIKQSKNPQMSTSMAEMISQRAAARDQRLAEGGEKRMRKVVIKEKDEYKKDFSSIVGDAAMMGRLTRLNEYTVEAVAQPKKPEEEWKSNGLLAIQWKSAHMSVIHDAAAAGNAFKMPEHVVSNFPEDDPAAMYNEATNQRFSDRMKQLLLLDEKVGEGMRKVDSLVDGRKEQKPKLNSLLIKPMQSYSTIEEVQLPRKTAPKINPAKNAEKLSKMKREALLSGRPMIDISANAAEVAWERRARLDRPGSLPKVKEICPCPYCQSASPYQTYAYREIDRQHRAHFEEHRQAQMQQAAEREEMERRERQRIREERRKLKQAVAEAEAAVARALAEVEATKVKTSQSETTMPPIVSSSTTASATYSTHWSAPEEAPPRTAKPHNLIQDRIGEWNNAKIPASKYKNDLPPPPVDAAGCKCTIM